MGLKPRVSTDQLDVAVVIVQLGMVAWLARVRRAYRQRELSVDDVYHRMLKK